MWLLQAKALLKLLDADLEKFVNTLLRVKVPEQSKKHRVFSDDL